MVLWRTDISLEVLIESGVAKTLKYVLDFCLAYLDEIPELRFLITNTAAILMRWKNFVANTIFDEQKDNIFVRKNKPS